MQNPSSSTEAVIVDVTAKVVALGTVAAVSFVASRRAAHHANQLVELVGNHLSPPQPAETATEGAPF